MNPNSLEAIDRATILHASTPLKQHRDGTLGGPRIVESGSGIRIRDTNGHESIDGFAGLYCVNVGYGRTEIADAIHAQAQKLAYYHTYAGHSNGKLIELSRRVLQDWAPAGMSKIYYGMSGSDANETNIKLVWHYWAVRGQPQRRKIISRLRGYHGSGIVTGSMTGLPLFHRSFGLPLDIVKHTVAPHAYWEARDGMDDEQFSAFCAEMLERKILEEGPETIAAFIGEPVLGTGGIVPPPAGYWPAIQAVLRKYEILLIDDEVVCAFGRLGSKFGAHLYGIEPDLITVAKGLTSAYLPLSGSIVSDRVWRVLEDGTDIYGVFGHGWTYSGHALAAAAGLANLDILEREGLTAQAGRVGAHLQAALGQALAAHPLVGEVRGVGMLAAVEFVADRTRKRRFDPALKVGARVAAACLARGLIARAMPHQDTLGLAPPLIATEADIDTIVAIVAASVQDVADALTREGAV
jgi:L-2,4-diaminobutyrate transaminase